MRSSDSLLQVALSRREEKLSLLAPTLMYLYICVLFGNIPEFWFPLIRFHFQDLVKLAVSNAAAETGKGGFWVIGN